HEAHLRAVFKVLEERAVTLSPDKSFIGFPSIELLGFNVDAFNLWNTEDRVRALKLVEFPRNLSSLEKWL
ncbi:hypothetical protein GCG54_00008375, partial [Colletotrichum gloeosporioides]